MLKTIRQKNDLLFDRQRRRDHATLFWVWIFDISIFYRPTNYNFDQVITQGERSDRSFYRIHTETFADDREGARGALECFQVF